MSEALCGHDRPVGRPAAATVKSAPIGTVRPAVPAWCRPRQLPAERLGLLLGSVSGIALLGALAAPMPAAAQTWNNAGSSIWSNSANWTPNTVPNGSGVTAVINNGGTANVDASFTVGTLTVGGTSSVSINNNAALTVDGSIANAGTLSMNSIANLTDLILGSGTNTLSGGGAVTLSNNVNNRIYGGAAGAILDNVDNIISGAGEIGVNGNLVTLINGTKGVVNANQTAALTIDSALGITNNGLLEATGTGGLRFISGNVVDSTGGGKIQANGAGAHVDLQNGTLKGGTLSTSGGGVIQTTSIGTLDGSTSAVTISSGSTVLVNNNTQLTLLGTIGNKGVIQVNSFANLTDLIMGSGTVTLNGGGNVALSNNGNNRIYAATGGTVLDNVDNTISGAGEIGVNGNFTLKNQSLIDANAGAALLIDAQNAVQNTGTIRSSGTTAGNGGLVLQNTTIDNTGSSNAGLITAIGANTHVDLRNATIKGGTITTSGGGLVQTLSSGTLDGTVAPVTISSGSTVQVNNATSLNLAGKVNAQGVINLNSSANLTDLIIAGASTVTLTGPGGITSSSNGNNRIYGNAAGAILDNVNSVIGGAGELGVNGNLTLKNESLVDANVAAPLLIDSPNAVQNTGTLRASNTTAGNGGLVLRSTTIDNTGSANAGLILATGANSHVDITNNTTILGGTLTGSGGGVINVAGSTLDGAGAGAPINITVGTAVNVANSQSIGLNGTINNHGTVTLNSVANLTDLIVGAKGVVLQGGGAVTLSDNGNNRIYSNTAGAVLENVDNTISGAGQVFQNAGMILKNDTAGVIDATGASPLSIGTFNANPVQNTGLLETTAGTGGLIITGGTTIDNTGNSNAGKITADGAGTHVDISNSTILGGTLTGKNGGVFNGSGSTLDGSTAGAPVTIAAGTVLNYGNSTTNFLVGTINNHGTIAQSSVANLTDLIIAAGGATLTGGGSLVLSNNGNNRVYANTAATVLDNVDNTISGAGQIFANAGLSLVNSGLVDANVSTPLVLSLNTTNNASGILRGSGAGGLAVSAGATTNNGTVEALNGSAVTFNGSSSITNNAGGTLTGGTWRAVSTGAGATVSLVGGTITTDAANLILDGAGSKIQAGTAGSYTDIQNTLTGVAPGGQLHVLNGQNYTTNTASNAIGNAGLVELGGGTFTDASFNNTGSLSGFGRLTSTAGNPLANSGQVTATGGNLILAQGVTGATGGITIANAASLDVSGATGGNSVGTLLHNGANLNLGTRNITVSTDYNNANFGSGNSFNNHANVTGTGSILAAGTGLSLTVSGSGVTGGGTASPTLALGNVHVGSPLGGSFSIDWAGTNAPALRGAVTSTSGLTVSAPGWGPIAPGGSQAETVTVAAGAAGSLSGQTLGVLTNFDNVAAKTISVTGAAYDLANPMITAPPQPIAFGNHHVGDAITQQAVTIQNQVVTSAAFQEGLDVTATPGAGRTATGSIGLLAAGKSSSAISVGIDSASAGNKSGNVALTLTSNGSGTSGLGTTPLPSQNVAVTGAIYNFATSNAIAPLHFVQHVGDGGGSVSQALIITNTAPAGAFSEGLNSGFGAYTPGVTDTLTPTFKGSITNLAAGATDSTSMLATIDTTKAGLFNGSTVVQQASNGATTSGLGITKLADQNVGVSGSVTGGVFVLASPQINNPPPGSPAIAFGNVRIGSSVANQAISVSNTASGPSGLVEALDANVILPPPAGITASGSFSGLAPGATDNSSLLVGLDTSTAGAHGGNLGVHFVSNGTGVSGDGTTTDLGSQNVAVSGSVYRLANPTLNTTSSSLAARVGDASPTSAISVTNTSPDTFTESLKASVTAFPSGFSNSGGTIGGLTAGSTDATTMRVGLNTGTSGVFSGNATVGFVSTGSGTDGAPDVPAGSASVALTGKVYQAAAASVSPSVNFGIVHVGDVVANKSINVANTASGNLVDSVTGSISTVSGPFTNGGGSLGSGVTAGSNSNALTVGLNTSKAGVFAGGTAGSATLALASHDNDLTDLSLGTTAVALSGQVNNFAVAAFGKTGGAGVLSGGGTSYVLNLGSFVQGSGAVNTSLFATNATTGPADLLDGSFSIFSGSGYLLSGFNPFVDLAAGIQDVGLDVTFDPTTQGLFSETIDLAGIGHNASGFSGALPDTFLTITASVGGTAGVPEPPSWAVLLAGLVGLGAAARRRMDGR